MSRLSRLAALFAFASLPLAGCVYAPYPYYYYAPSYDRAWNASLGAVRDAGVKVLSEDYGTGVIKGQTNDVDVTVVVERLPDGRVRVQFDSKGQTSRDPGLSDRFSQAYERRMGR
jgi:hypothetical protein